MRIPFPPPSVEPPPEHHPHASFFDLSILPIIPSKSIPSPLSPSPTQQPHLPRRNLGYIIKNTRQKYKCPTRLHQRNRSNTYKSREKSKGPTISTPPSPTQPRRNYKNETKIKLPDPLHQRNRSIPIKNKEIPKGPNTPPHPPQLNLGETINNYTKIKMSDSLPLHQRNHSKHIKNERNV